MSEINRQEKFQQILSSISGCPPTSSQAQHSNDTMENTSGGASSPDVNMSQPHSFAGSIVPNYSNLSIAGPKTGGNVYDVLLPDDNGGVEMISARPLLFRSMEIRDKYKNTDKGQLEGFEKLQTPLFLQVDDGVFGFSDQRTVVVPWEQFYDDVFMLVECAQDQRCQAACRYRLQVLEEKYRIYKLYNGEVEESNGHYHGGGGVFAHSTKVDNCVRMDTMMNAQFLVDYILGIFETRVDDVVGFSELEEMITLGHMLELWDAKDLYLITPSGIGLQPSPEKPSSRYDPLNPDMNRGGRHCAEMLYLFLSRDTYNMGAYFGDALRPYFYRSEDKDRCIHATETVIEVTGLFSDEWEKVADWVGENDLMYAPANTFIISFNRQKMKDLRRSGRSNEKGFRVAADTPVSLYENHQQHLDNLFLPLFLATMSPEDLKNIPLANFLGNIGGFMIVFEDEESVEAIQRNCRRPADVPWSENVGDLYFAYYVWANLCSLNSFRRRRNMNVFQLRAVAGSQRASTSNDSIVVSYIIADSIVNGIALESQPVLQYLYRLKGIGVSMHPLTNCGQGMNYVDHPFGSLFRRGLKVTLCTMHPLFYHHSDDPIIEEYGTASKLLRMSGVDMCEIALNSVMISTFSHEAKCAWLGEAFVVAGNRGNSFDLSFVPTARLDFRLESWNSEMEIICSTPGSVSIQPVIMPTVGPSIEKAAAQGSELEEDSSGALICSPSMEARAAEAKLSSAPYVVFDPAVEFHRLRIVGIFDRDSQYSVAGHLFHRALELRNSYTGSNSNGESEVELFEQHNNLQIELAFSRNKDNSFDEDEWTFKTVEGVVVPHEVHQIPRLPKDMYHFEDFRAHVEEIKEFIDRIPIRNFANQRLKLLEHKFNLHTAVNHSLEAGSTADKASQNRDFYQSTKVDNTIRMDAGMTARQLLDFIVSKAHNNGDDIVSHQKGKEPQTLRQLLSELHISPDSLTVDDLNVQANTTLGVAGGQYTPEGRDELLTLLLKTDNQMKGRYFAELTKLTFENLKRDRFTFNENRLPIYGASEEEWALVSTWFDTHGMSSSHNQWMVQIPRIYGYLRKKGKVSSFAEYIENIFKPLWSVSLHPNKDPRLFHFVNHISGFDCIEDEHRLDMPLSLATAPPHEWTVEEDPPYNYYMYHIWANIYTLNEFRRRRQFSTFLFRPSCGEAGQIDHLVGAFLLSNGISYGVQLGANPPVQYLFYLAQIGVTVSPLSNNTKVLDYLDNPFPKFFRRGLMVTLGTDGPLMYHHTQEPLLEEYSIASKIWKLSPNDMCEIARSSVLLSGFSPSFKQERLGKMYFLSSSASNDSSRTHLSDVRVGYRFETYHSEIGFLEYISGLSFQKSMLTLAEEVQCKTKFLKIESEHKKTTEYRGIIDSKPEQEEIKKLLVQYNNMESELNDLMKVMGQLQHENKLITAKLVAERTKVQEERLRTRNRSEKRVSQRGSGVQDLTISTGMNESDGASQPMELSEAANGKGVASEGNGGARGIDGRKSDPIAESLGDGRNPFAAFLSASRADNSLLMHKETLWSRDTLSTKRSIPAKLPSLQ